MEGKPTYERRETCRACNSKGLATLLNFGEQYLVNFVKERDESLPKAPLEWCQCMVCGLLQLRHTVDGDLLWRDYWYRSGVNASMRASLTDVVSDGLRYHGQGTWLDIGANDGTLLSLVPTDRFHKIGIEPALNLGPVLEEHADLAIMDYFRGDLVKAHSCQVVTSIAMFYDLDDPHQFIDGIQRVMTDDGVWINQLSDTAQMLKANAFDNICHEHVCYYDLATLKRLYADHGLTIYSVSLNDTNGGSIRVVAGRNPEPAWSWSGVPSVTAGDVSRFCNRVVRWKDVMMQLILGGLMEGKALWLYGASTKACMMLQYLDLNERFFACADRNPHKYGLRMAGTWIPITDEVTMRSAKPDFLVVGPWAFRKEFIEREEQLRATGTTMLFPLPNPELVL